MGTLQGFYIIKYIYHWIQIYCLGEISFDVKCHTIANKQGFCRKKKKKKENAKSGKDAKRKGIIINSDKKYEPLIRLVIDLDR